MIEKWKKREKKASKELGFIQKNEKAKGIL
jgi:hypothetical protein